MQWRHRRSTERSPAVETRFQEQYLNHSSDRRRWSDMTAAAAAAAGVASRMGGLNRVDHASWVTAVNERVTKLLFSSIVLVAAARPMPNAATAAICDIIRTRT